MRPPPFVLGLFVVLTLLCAAAAPLPGTVTMAKNLEAL